MSSIYNIKFSGKSLLGMNRGDAMSWAKHLSDKGISYEVKKGIEEAAVRTGSLSKGGASGAGIYGALGGAAYAKVKNTADKLKADSDNMTKSVSSEVDMGNKRRASLRSMMKDSRKAVISQG